MPLSDDRSLSPLRRFLPRSLLGRSLLILGLPIVAVQLISLWFFYDPSRSECDTPDGAESGP